MRPLTLLICGILVLLAACGGDPAPAPGAGANSNPDPADAAPTPAETATTPGWSEGEASLIVDLGGSPENLHEIKLGMSGADVKRALGEPNQSITYDDNSESWTYSSNTGGYQVQLRDGVVTRLRSIAVSIDDDASAGPNPAPPPMTPAEPEPAPPAPPAPAPTHDEMML